MLFLLYEKLDYINIENANKYIKSIDIEDDKEFDISKLNPEIEFLKWKVQNGFVLIRDI